MDTNVGTKLIIGEIYKTSNQSEVNGDAAQLCANIDFVNPNTGRTDNKVLYFEVEKEYESALCTGRSDAFVIGLLISAMENGYDIEWVTPISERLLYQISTYYVPMLSSYNKRRLKKISLSGPYTSVKIKSDENAVATGCSGGGFLLYSD